MLLMKDILLTYIAGELENSKCYLIKSGQERVYVSSTMGLHGIIVEHDGNQRGSICMARAKKQLERKNKLIVYLCKCSRETQKTLSDFRGLA